MASGLDVQSDPVFWWWEEDGGSRVVLLTDTVLILSGALADAALGELEAARRAGTVEAADFGADACRISVGAIERLRYVPDSHRLEVDLAGGGRFDVEPPRSNAGVALGVFDTLAKRLAPDDEPVDSHAGGVPTAEDPALTIVGAMVVLGLVCLGLAVAADQGQPTGPLSGVRTSLNDLFEQLGYLPALVLFVIATVVQVTRMRRSADEDGDAAPVRTTRVLELDLTGRGAADAPAPVVDPLADIATPQGNGDEWQPLADAAAGAWSPPETSSAWGEPTDARSESEAESTAEGWTPPHTNDVADVTADEVTPVDSWAEPAEDAWQDDEAGLAGEAPDGPLDDAADESWSAPVDDVAVESWSARTEDVAVDGWSTPVDDGAVESWSAPTDDVAVEGWSASSDVVAVEASVTSSEELDVDEVPPVADVDPEFWSQSKRDRSDDPWWERDDAADAGDPGLLPVPPPTFEVPVPDQDHVERVAGDDSAAVSEGDPIWPAEVDDPMPVVESVDAPSWDAEPEVEVPVPAVDTVDAPSWDAEPEVEVPVPAVESVDAPSWDAETEPEELATSWDAEPEVEDPMPVFESVDAPSWDAEPEVEDPTPVVESVDAPSWDAEPEPEELAASAPSVPAADSPFAEILDREAPLPAWASAPEPTNQLVDRAAMERSIPASLVPETAERD